MKKNWLTSNRLFCNQWLRAFGLPVLLAVAMAGCASSQNGGDDKNDSNDTAAKAANAKTNADKQPAVKNKDVKIAKISTKFGDILVWLHDATPKHKENFLKLAGNGFYDSTTFHRVIDGFMIQGGDPNTKKENPTKVGQGGPGYKIEAEFVKGLKHDYGAVAAARQGDRVNPKRKSSGSQFYIVENKNGTHQLDGKYTVFGQVIKGMEVVETIAEQPTKKRDQPKSPIRMDVDVVETTTKKLNKNYDFKPPKIGG